MAGLLGWKQTVGTHDDTSKTFSGVELTLSHLSFGVEYTIQIHELSERHIMLILIAMVYLRY